MLDAFTPLSLKAVPPPGPDGGIVDPDRTPDQLDEAERWLLCSRCRARITQPRFAREVQGKFAHTFTNPFGITFDVGCYRDAPGAGAHGQAHAADSWFAGYVWRVAACGGCHCHLGWRFSSGEHLFWGLIREALSEERSG